MSKITRLEQLKNENSLYRVSGLFEKSEICWIKAEGNLGVVLYPVLETEVKAYHMASYVLQDRITTGSVAIMCLQRGGEYEL